MRDEEILESVIRRFRRVACSPQADEKFPVGAESAKAMGYDPRDIDALPPAATESFAGVGNPLSLGQIQEGQTILDLGCGAGLDGILAARKAGSRGRVIGIDLTNEMVEKASRNAAAAGVTNVEFRQANVEAIPLDSGSVDLAITNGVLNLCLNKAGVLAEVFRTLRPGGRVQMADILLEDHVTPDEVAKKGEWSD